MDSGVVEVWGLMALDRSVQAQALGRVMVLCPLVRQCTHVVSFSIQVYK